MFIDKKTSHTSNPNGVYLTLFIFAILSFLQWEPPGFYVWLESFRWYFMLGVAGFIFIVQGGRLSISGARFYILFSILSWLGAFLSLLRTPLPEQVLYSTVSMIIPFSLGLVFIPVISINKGRWVWVGALIIAALLWAYKVVQLWIIEGENVRHILYGPGLDHNLVAFVLAMAATALMVIALNGNSKPVKIIAFLASVGLLACSFLTYSRSGFIITVFGMFSAIFALVLSNQKKTLMVVLFIMVILFFGINISNAIPSIQETNPTWFRKFDEIFRLDDPNTSVFVRTVLYRKALSLIQENPVIGIGPDVFRTIYDPKIGHQSIYMVHNSYLAAWVERGVLGLAGYIIWVILWIRLFLTRWNNFNLIKRVLLSTFAPFFLMLFFLDIGGFPLYFMLIIFSSLYSSSDDESPPPTENCVDLV